MGNERVIFSNRFDRPTLEQIEKEMKKENYDDNENLMSAEEFLDFMKKNRNGSTFSPHFLNFLQNHLTNEMSCCNIYTRHKCRLCVLDYNTPLMSCQYEFAK